MRFSDLLRQKATRSMVLAASLAILAALVTAPAVAAEAGDMEPRVAHVFQDNMVLQRDMAVPVWGWAAPGTEVTVSFAGQKKSAKADEGGYWKATLEPLAASSEGRELTVVIGDKTITRRNVLVGEVWLAAGQSNMNAGGPDQDTGVYPHHVSPGKEGGKPEIRIMMYGFGASLEPLADVDASQRRDAPWQTFDESAKSMNLSRYFARVVRDELNVPVGIVHVAVSGTNQAAWMAKQTLEAFPSAAGKANFYEQFLAEREEAQAKSKGEIKSWADFQKAEAQWRESGYKGQWPGRAVSSLQDYPSALYNTRIHPVAPLAMRGIIWHQGEAGPGGPYGKRLVAMARQWRELFGQDLYFIWGTLSRHTVSAPPLKPELSWFYRSSTNVEIRDALKQFGDDKWVALVEFYDLGGTDTHFLQKAEAGRRMGLAALTVAYGKEHIYTGPRVTEVAISGNKATLRYDHVGKGLVYKPSLDGISGFIVKGKSGQLRWAEVKVVDGSTLEVSHPEVTDLEGVGYAVAPNPHETLFNSEGLPASPFRHNLGRVEYGAADARLVRVVDAGEAKIVRNIAHVRREGYVFSLLGGAGKVAVEAYLPKEWEGFEVEIGGKAVEARTEERDGQKVAVFEAPVDGSWIIVAAKGKAAELRSVNRY